MSGGYEGQPEYVRDGFLTDLFEAWGMALHNDEAGRVIDAMIALAQSCVSTSDHERLPVVLGWIREDLTFWHDEDWYEDFDERTRDPRKRFEEIVSYWRDRARGFNGSAPGTETVASDALEETVTGLPDWFRPDPNAPPPPDPERAAYERLRARFGSE